MLVERAIADFVERALAQGGLLLAPGVRPDELVAELLAALDEQAAFAQLGPFVARALLLSPRVEELFLDDRQIVLLFNGMD